VEWVLYDIGEMEEDQHATVHPAHLVTPAIPQVSDLPWSV